LLIIAAKIQFRCKGKRRKVLCSCLKYRIVLLLECRKTNNCGKSQIKPYLCPIILKGCLALSNQTERQAEIKPMPPAPLKGEFIVLKIFSLSYTLPL